MTPPTLWNFDLDDACYRVRLMASLTGLPLTLRSVDVVPGDEPRGPEMLALNPLGRLPLFQDGALVLRQTEAILLHVARRAPRGAAFLPEATHDADLRAEIEDWLIFAACEMRAASEARQLALFGTDIAATEDAAEAALAALTLLEDHLTERLLQGETFVAGRAASVADVALFPGFALSRDFGLDHDDFPALRRWARAIRGLSGFLTMPGIPEPH
jgi:glutathione S-transferase